MKAERSECFYIQSLLYDMSKCQWSSYGPFCLLIFSGINRMNQSVMMRNEEAIHECNVAEADGQCMVVVLDEEGTTDD